MDLLFPVATTNADEDDVINNVRDRRFSVVSIQLDVMRVFLFFFSWSLGSDITRIKYAL